MDVLSLFVGIAIGATVGALAVAALRRGEGERVARAEEAARQQHQQLESLTAQVESARTGEARVREQLAALEPELAAAKARFEEQKQFFDEARKQLVDSFSSTGQAALAANSEQFLKLADKTFAPMKDLLTQQGQAVQKLEDNRLKAYTQLSTTIEHLMAGHRQLGETTGQLASALRRPDQRGKWGEMQLRNVVELAGMVEHCDFQEQVSVQGEDGRQQPDMVVRLPGNGQLVVDAKAPLERYLDALEAPAGPDRDALLARHADQLSSHVKALSAKAYWKNFDPAPEAVVLFIPLESALTAALETDPTIHAKALESKVLIATPTLLLGLLRAVSFGWRQEAVAQNAERIAKLGRELHDRIRVFLESWDDVGHKLDMAVAAYNKSVGSMETRLLVSARKLQELGAATDQELPDASGTSNDVRRLSSDLTEPTQ
ncbi:MAG: DNA recombination protein RmuC [Phycisphaerales bacterium]|nr:DNA recombination protein RmuC [Phycisphaerales bacterium]